ncbi:MAG: hypothetical protein Tsb004_15460 [Allomuricauda sp.]
MIQDSIWFKTYRKLNNHVLLPEIIDVLKSVSDSTEIEMEDIGLFNMLVQNYDCTQLTVTDFQIKYPFAKTDYIKNKFDHLVKVGLLQKSDTIFRLSKKGKQLLEMLSEQYRNIDGSKVDVFTLNILESVTKNALSNRFEGYNPSLRNCMRASLRFDDSDHKFLRLITVMNDLVALRNDQSHYRYSLLKNNWFDPKDQLSHPMMELLAGLSNHKMFKTTSFTSRPTWGYTEAETQAYLDTLRDKGFIVQLDTVLQLTNKAKEMERRASTAFEQQFYQPWLHLPIGDYKKFKASIK